jgi:hypothetical protein
LIFSKQLTQQILAGTKTETRRLVKGDGTVTLARRRGQTVVRRPFEPKVGKSYAVQPGRGKPELFRIVCTSRRRELLGTLDHAAAVAEGFPRGVAAFAIYWLSLYEPAWPALERVFCPTCTLDADYPADELPPCPMCDGESEIRIRPTPTDEEAVARFNERWADRMVWVIGFQVDPSSRTRLLLEHRGGELRGDYTTSSQQTMSQPVEDERGQVRHVPEPEALSDTEWDTHVGRRAGMTAQQWVEVEQARRDQDRHRRSIEERMRSARQQGRQSVDLRGEFRVLDQMLDQRTAPEKVERQLVRIEGKLDRQHRQKHGPLEQAA